jgi:hypothetical protein
MEEDEGQVGKKRTSSPITNAELGYSDWMRPVPTVPRTAEASMPNKRICVPARPLHMHRKGEKGAGH